jgi:hypothetical protein
MLALIQKKKVLSLVKKWKLSRGRWGLGLTLILVSLLVGFLMGQAAGANSALVPGSENDPLVTASWVEARLSAFSRGESSASAQPVYITTPAPSFEVVNVPANKKVTGSGTELILRSGKAKAVEGAGGGLSDLTEGRNLSSGDAVKANHLLLAIKEDGRGVVTESEAIFLVRGAYKIE